MSTSPCSSSPELASRPLSSSVSAVSSLEVGKLAAGFRLASVPESLVRLGAHFFFVQAIADVSDETIELKRWFMVSLCTCAPARQVATGKVSCEMKIGEGNVKVSYSCDCLGGMPPRAAKPISTCMLTDVHL